MCADNEDKKKNTTKTKRTHTHNHKARLTKGIESNNEIKEDTHTHIWLCMCV